MACKKYVLTNTGDTSYFYFNYKRCSDGLWEYETALQPGQTKTIYIEDGSYSTAFPNNGSAVLTDDGTFPPVHVPTTTTTTTVPPQPTVSNESWLTMAINTGDTGFNAVVMDYENETISNLPANMGSDWDINDLYPMNEKGYMILYISNTTPDTYFIQFTDWQFNIILDHQTTTNSYDWGYDDGKITYFIDYENGVLLYSDGNDAYELHFQGVDVLYDIAWDYDLMSKSNSFVVYTINNNSDTRSARLIKDGNEVEILDTWNPSYIDKYYATYRGGNFIVELSWDYNLDVYSEYRILSAVDGSVIETHNLLGSLYNTYDYSFYGHNKFMIVFYRGGDYDIDYNFYHYNGDTNTSSNYTHARGDNYRYNNFWSQDFTTSNPSDYPSETISVTLYGDNDNWNWNSGYYYTYLDIVYVLDGENIENYTYTDTGGYDKSIFMYGEGNAIQARCDIGDGYLNIMTLKTDGTAIYTQLEPLASVDDIWWSHMDGFTIQTDWYTGNHTAGRVNIIKDNGDVVQSKEFLLLSNYGINNSNTPNIYYYTDSSHGWYYINGVTAELTQTSKYDYRYSPYYYNADTELLQDTILLVNSSTLACRVLSMDGITSEFTLPSSGSWDIKVGQDSFMYVYVDGNVIINIYDYQGNLLNSYDTGYDNNDGWNSYGDRHRFKVNYYDGTNNVYCLVTPNVFSSQVLSNGSTYNAPNDYPHWND